MKRFPFFTALGLLAACRGLEENERWMYERLSWEQEPQIRSHEDSRKRFEELSERPELTLDEAYQMALHRGESLAISGEELVRLQARYEQARGAILPLLSFKGSYTRQDQSGVSSSNGSVSSSFTQRDRTEYKVSGHQTIFGGLKEFHTLREGSALYEAREHDLRHARLLLFGDVADAFYLVLLAGRDLETVQGSLALAEERLEELVQRNRAGISRRSEVLAQEAEAASTRAEAERRKGASEVAWEALKFLTGLREPRKLVDAPSAPAELPSVEASLARALAGRNDVKALERQIAAARETIGVARAGYFPTVALDGNYYTHREDISADVDWDLILSFEIPLFEGGVTQAKIREARSNVRSAELQIERLRREIAVQINRALADARALQSELASLDKAVASAEENHEIVQAEFRRDIVTHIEVLAAFNTLQRVRLDRARARFQAKLSGVRLSLQTGSLPGGDR